MSWTALHAASPVGPSLLALGLVALLAGGIVHGLAGWPTILPARPGEEQRPPMLAERISVHLLGYGVWAVGFGAVVWRGVPAGMIDVRLPFERRWPVIEEAEWVYLSVYLIPLAMPWLAPTRGVLRRYVRELGWLLLISVACFVVLPLGSPPRGFEPGTLAGRILAWETGRADFASASFPSFHVFWGLLCARVLASRGRVIGAIGRTWAGAVAVSCLANGAHAIADVIASFAIYAAVAVRLGAEGSRREASRPIRNPATAPTARAPAPK